MLTLGWQEQPGGLFFKDSLASQTKDPAWAAANRVAAGWDKKTRELAKKKAIRKQQARDRGEETSSEDGDDDDESDETVADVDWGDLVNEDSLSLLGPLPFHVKGSKSAGTVEPGLPLGSAGAGGSAVTHRVPAVDRWMGGDGFEAVPEVLAEGGGSDAMARELMEGGGSGAAPHEPMERSGSGAVPPEARETSPPASEQGAGL